MSVVGKVALEGFLSEYCCFVMSVSFHRHPVTPISFIYHSRHIVLAVDKVVKQSCSLFPLCQPQYHSNLLCGSPYKFLRFSWNSFFSDDGLLSSYIVQDEDLFRRLAENYWIHLQVYWIWFMTEWSEFKCIFTKGKWIHININRVPSKVSFFVRIEFFSYCKYVKFLWVRFKVFKPGTLTIVVLWVLSYLKFIHQNDVRKKKLATYIKPPSKISHLFVLQDGGQPFKMQHHVSCFHLPTKTTASGLIYTMDSVSLT